MDGPRQDLASLWAPLWLGTSSSLALWSTSGMEQPLAMFLPLAGAYLLWTSWDSEDRPYRAAASGVVMGLGCMTRPEIHLIGILLGLPLVWRVARDRQIDRPTRYWFAGLLGVTVPFHTFRYFYFGGLLPNTYYVKTGGGEMVWHTGLRRLREMFEFNYLGYLVLLVPFAFLTKKHLREKLVMLGVALGFMVYIVKVGKDEMRWHRLYLPALPFLVLLAGIGLRNICASVAELFSLRSWKRIGVYILAWALVFTAGSLNFSFTYQQKAGFNGRGPLSGNYHPDMGKFLTRHAPPGSLVAFQDMGSTPYHAPDLKFLDFIGLVDETVARARHGYGLHAFVPTGDYRALSKYNADMREYFYERSPEWVILTSYIPSGAAGRVSKRFAKNPDPSSLEPYVGNNSYQFGIYNDRFKKQYAHVRAWPRSATYYLALFQRRDLWEETPGEVVIDRDILDAAPIESAEPEVVFDEGLELLGTDMEHTATVKQEFFVTTWWRLPGALSEDITFFMHLERPGSRTPFDHKPGDSMYPADRWKQGQLLEDRILFQIPQHVRPGSYDLYMGVYDRQTGERMEVKTGDHDGNNRVHLGEVTVEPFTPFLEHIILPTRVDEMRKYPERIPSSD